MTSIRFARRAFRDVERLDAWWRANRQAAPRLFVLELAAVVRLLRLAPELGPLYAAGGRPVHRVLLQETQYYVYYRYERAKNIVVILTVSGTQRRRGPVLR